MPPSTIRIPVGDEAQSTVSRDLLRRAVDATRPVLQLGGHWHDRRVFTIYHPQGPPTTVHVLDMDGSSANWVVLDLSTLTVRDPAAASANC